MTISNKLTSTKLTSSLRATSLLVALFAITQLPSCGSRTTPAQDGAEVKDLSLATRGPAKDFYGFYGHQLKSISSGGQHTCAVDDEGVKCWGEHYHGQTYVPSGLKNPRLVSSGAAYNCAIDDEGVKCWGNNSYGQTNVPAGLNNPKLVSCGWSHTCALDDEGVKCWGDNDHGQTDVPAGLKNPRLVSSGYEHTCAIDDEGVKCWGRNIFGQTNVPAGLKNPRLISSGYEHTCAIDDEGVKCWGWNRQGQTNVPAGLNNPRLVSSGYEHTCAIDDEGVKCWGFNEYGQTNVPAGLNNPRLVSSGELHTCAIDDEGVKCWGWGSRSDVPPLRYSYDWRPWPQILSQSLTGDKLQFFNLIQKTIFESMPSNADINSKEDQILVLLMSRYVTEFPSDFFRQTIKPVWEENLNSFAAATSIHSAKEIPQTKDTLTVAVKLLNGAFVSVKPMLGSSEQKEVEAIVLAINDTLAGDMSAASAKALAKKIKTHKKLLDTMASSDAVHITSVVTQDALAWIMED